MCIRHDDYVLSLRRTVQAWSFYLALGDKSWERITDGPWRRRVGLRFMFTLLVLDPASYTVGMTGLIIRY